MFNIAQRPYWIDEVRLEYWRQMIRLTRLARKLLTWFLPIREYLWIPLVAGLCGVIVGLLITVA